MNNIILEKHTLPVLKSEKLLKRNKLLTIQNINKDFELENSKEYKSITSNLHEDYARIQFKEILTEAIHKGASDIHIEPFEDEIVIRIRVDGQLSKILTIATESYSFLLTVIKLDSGMNIAEKRLPQDGHFVGRVEGLELNMRVSVIPTVFGEKIVMRYLNSNTPITRSDTYGMTLDNYNKIESMINMPHGIIYVTGPTGSGKTTTLYMLLESISKRQINISTIEDPVEKNLPRINQTQVNNMAGLTFEVGLRSLMRQDPDIIMVGETRDAETAEISVRAAITGHLVLSYE